MNNLLNTNLALYQENSCIYQSLSRIYKTQSSCDSNPSHDIRAVFADISNAFDKAWHEGLMD